MSPLSLAPEPIRPSPMFDVAIVGYGPVGQALALSLAQRGHTVVVFERQLHAYGLPRAVGLDHEAMRILQSLGVMEAFESHTRPSSAYEWHNGDGDLLISFPMGRLAPSGWPEMSSFTQPALERLLDDQLREQHPGQVVVHRGVTVTSLTEQPGRVVVGSQATSGEAGVEMPTVEARYVVGCDGAASFVRGAIGARLEEIAFAADWLVVDIQPRDVARWSGEVVQICDPRRPTTKVPGGAGRRRFEFMMLEGERKEDMNNAAVAWRLLEPWGWRPDNAVLERHAVYTFRAAVADVWRHSRLLIAGDAAHMTPPFAAQGLCAGLRDVAALAWRLDLVLRSQASDALLDGYGAERRPHARILVEWAVELGKIICVLDADVAKARDAQLLDKTRRDSKSFPELRLGASSLQRVGDATAGVLGVQGRVRYRGRSARFDEFFGAGFVLIGHGHDPARRLDPAQRAFVQSLRVQTVAIGAGCEVQDLDGTYARWFEALGADTVLVRPDFYVFGSGEASALVGALMAAWTGCAAGDDRPA